MSAGAWIDIVTTDEPSAPARGMKRCPACAEEIQEAAIICRYCGYDYAAGLRRTTAAQAPAATRTNGLAIASLVLGIVWVWWVGSILALVFGYVARRQIKASEGTQSGSGMAMAGIVLGWVGVGFLILYILIVIVAVAAD